MSMQLEYDMGSCHYCWSMTNTYTCSFLVLLIWTLIYFALVTFHSFIIMRCFVFPKTAELKIFLMLSEKIMLYFASSEKKTRFLWKLLQRCLDLRFTPEPCENIIFALKVSFMIRTTLNFSMAIINSSCVSLNVQPTQPIMVLIIFIGPCII